VHGFWWLSEPLLLPRDSRPLFLLLARDLETRWARRLFWWAWICCLCATVSGFRGRPVWFVWLLWEGLYSFRSFHWLLVLWLSNAPFFIYCSAPAKEDFLKKSFQHKNVGASSLFVIQWGHLLFKSMKIHTCIEGRFCTKTAISKNNSPCYNREAASLLNFAASRQLLRDASVDRNRTSDLPLGLRVE